LTYPGFILNFESQNAVYILAMTDTVENLVLDLLEWVARKPRTYHETMDAWRTSCPRLPVWEDASGRGLVETIAANGDWHVRVTPLGLDLLRQKRPQSFGQVVSVASSSCA
jgi:hypothetical protein